jgi:hypothetical protein
MLVAKLEYEKAGVWEYPLVVLLVAWTVETSEYLRVEKWE